MFDRNPVTPQDSETALLASILEELKDIKESMRRMRDDVDRMKNDVNRIAAKAR